MKKKISVTIDVLVLAAIGPMQAALESQAHGATAADDIRALYGPIRYSRSTIVQMALMLLAERLDITVDWPTRQAMDIASGESVPIPDGTKILDSPEDA
jgi:hypothetical protein